MVSRAEFDKLFQDVGFLSERCLEAKQEVSENFDDITRYHEEYEETRVKLEALVVYVNDTLTKQHEDALSGLQDALHALVSKQRLTIRALEDRVKKAESHSRNLAESFKRRDVHFSKMEKMHAAKFERHIACMEALQLRVSRLEDVADWDATDTMDTGPSDMGSQRN